jgi:serine O-acetyltransferase
VIQDGIRVQNDLDQVNLPDPIAELCRSMQAEIQALKEEVKKLKQGQQDESSARNEQGGNKDNDHPALQHTDQE